MFNTIEYPFKRIILASLFLLFLFCFTSTVKADNPTPTTSSISPTVQLVGSPGFTITVSGTNFITSSVVNFNNSPRSTTFVSSIQLTAVIPDSDLTTPGTYNITVFNPAPGGGTSNPQIFTVSSTVNPIPTITSINPTSKTVGVPIGDLVVTGTNFIQGSLVAFNNPPYLPSSSYSVDSSTQITVFASFVNSLSSGVYYVTVTNPQPGGGTSNSHTFTINSLTPTLASISPSSKGVGDPQFTLTVNGTDFVPSSIVKFDNSSRITTFVSSTQLTAVIPASDLTTPGTYNIIVFNPAPGGGTSNSQVFTVNTEPTPPNPVPTITSIDPESVNVCDPPFTLGVNGTNFIPTSVIYFNGLAALPTTYISSTRITAFISPIPSPAVYDIVVVNPEPGGGTSNFQQLTIVGDPDPVITGIDPPTQLVGGPDFILTVYGSDFTIDSVVNFDGSPRATTFISPTQLTAFIPASDLTVQGDFNITVTNASPCPRTSNPAVFTTLNPVPTITNINPSSVDICDTNVTLTVDGTNFIPTSVIHIDGNPLQTTYVSSTQLTTFMVSLTSIVPSPGTYYISVVNPPPNGGSSNILPMTVTGDPNPVVTSINPSSKSIGDPAFTLTVDGTGFTSSSIVNFNNSPKTTTFISSTQITAQISASDLSSEGQVYVTVTNVLPCGQTSNQTVFTITSPQNPIPTTTSISPTQKTVGDSDFTMTVNGTNFISSSVIYIGSFALSTTYVSSTQLTTFISPVPQADIYFITVVNPSPGGGISNSQNFTVNNLFPSTTSISPTSILVNSVDFTMNISGTNFVSNSVVNFNNSPRSTTFVSLTELTAVILASDLTTPGTYNVTVFNPPPSGGTSNPQVFTVSSTANPIPTTTGIFPASVQEGDPPFTLIVNGINFIPTSIVYIGNFALPTTYVDGTQINALISPVPPPATYYITVVNPAPGGGTSNSQTFTVVSLMSENPPFVTNWSVFSDYCPISPNTVAAFFSWTYNDVDGDNEYQFQFQIDNNSDFSSLVVDRTFSNLSNPPGTINQQSVFITDVENNSMAFNRSYYWRIRVWQVAPPPGGPGLDSGWVNAGTYTTVVHSGPYSSFSFSPSSPTQGNPVFFTNNSTCYVFSGGVSTPAACQSYLWDFGDTDTSTAQNPTHIYSTTGPFNVNLKAYDELGFCETNQTVNVSQQLALPKWKEISPF